MSDVQTPIQTLNRPDGESLAFKAIDSVLRVNIDQGKTHTFPCNLNNVYSKNRLVTGLQRINHESTSRIYSVSLARHFTFCTLNVQRSDTDSMKPVNKFIVGIVLT